MLVCQIWYTLPIATPIFSHLIIVSGLGFRLFCHCIFVVVVLYFLIWSYRMSWAGLFQVRWFRKPSVAVQFWVGRSSQDVVARARFVFVSSGSIQIFFARATDCVWYRPEGSAYSLERDFLRSSERGVCFRVPSSSEHSGARACSRVADLKHCILGSSELFFARVRFSCVWSLERPSLRSSEPVRFK